MKSLIETVKAMYIKENYSANTNAPCDEGGDASKQADKKKKFADAAAAANKTSTTPGATDTIKKQGVAEAAVEEGVVDMVKTGAKKVLAKVGGGSDEDQLKRLQKNMGVPQTGKKPAMKEETEEQVDETVIHKDMEYTIAEADKNYDKYFKAKMKANGGMGNTDDEKKKFFNKVDKGFKAKNEETFVEAFMSSDLADVKAAHKKAGNRITDEKSGTRDGKAMHSFVVTTPEGKRTRHIYHGTTKKLESMSPAKKSKESSEQDLDDK